jgi:hypothetical protein
LLYNFLDILQQIEIGELTQHEGSFKVGTILKQIYIDSALKKSEKLDKQNETNEVPVKPKEHLNISWKEYKRNR